MARQGVGKAQRGEATRTLLRAGIILGIGVVGTLDEVVLHQLLQWHNFYVHAEPFWRIFSDGLFHLVTSGLLLLGALLLWSRRDLIASMRDGRALAAGVFFGMGGFNLFDAIVDHKILELHPVRENVANILPYDLAFGSIAIALLAVGAFLWRGVRT